MKKATKTELATLAKLSDEQINLEDIPEVQDWSNAKRGQFFRPKKQQISLRVDADILAWFKSSGAKYQTRMNEVLRDHMDKGVSGV